MARKQDLRIRHQGTHARPLAAQKKQAQKKAGPEETAETPEERIPAAQARRSAPAQKRSSPERVQFPDPAPQEAAPVLEEVPAPRKRRRGRSVVWLVFSRLVLLGVLGVGGFLLWQNWEKIAPDSLVIWVEDKLSGGGGGDGFPVEVAGSSVQYLEPLEGNLAMLSDTAFTILNSRGGELVRRPHMYSNPLMVTAGKYALLAESAGTRVSLETRAKTVWSLTMQNPVISAAVSKNGTVAVLTEAGQSYSTEVIVFDRKGEEIYRRSRSSQAVGVAVSPSGDHIALISITAEAGAIKSVLEVFTLDAEQEPVYSHEETDVMLCAVGYLSDGKIAAVGDTAMWIADAEAGTFVQKSYDGQQLLGYALGKNSAAVVTRPYGSTGGGRFLLVKEDGTAAYTMDFDADFRDIAARDDGYVLLTGAGLQAMEPAQPGAQLQTSGDGLLVSPMGDAVLVLGLTSLTEYQLD